MADSSVKPACKYGIKCYRQNQSHKDQFSHPPKDRPQDDDDDDRGSKSPPPPAKKRKPSTPLQHESNIDVDDEKCSDEENEDEIKSDDENHGESEDEKAETIDNEEDNKSEKDDSVVEIESSSNESSSKYDTAIAETSDEPSSTTTEPVGVRCSEFINEHFHEGPFAQRAELKKLLESPPDFISSTFLVTMPNDFYAFWEFCKSESKNSSNPETLFKKFGLNLVGPFDVLAKKFDNVDPFEPGDYLRHWRFYYDPPEFQTLMVKEKSGIHYGYWRDEPSGECFIARNDATKNCEFTFIADNIFGAVLLFLENDTQLSPFNRAAALSLKKSIEDFANGKNISLTTFSAKLKARNLKTVCKTFHRAGLAVPYNRKTSIGYRQLGESDANLKKILNKFTEAKGDKDKITAAMDQLQPLITAANIACDESDFGTAIELGLDLFCFGEPELHSDALQLLATGYKLVNKPQFIAIIKAHLQNRTKGYTGLSILNSVKRSADPDSTK